jgi:allatostatin receptor
MSLDRYLAVAHPIQSMSIRTERNAYLAIFFTWITIFLACIPALISHGIITFEDSDYPVCLFLVNDYNQSLYQICFFLSSYVIPISIILVLYVLMLKRLWFGVVPGGHMSAESVRSKKRVTRMVVVVVIIFACCWCPIQVVLVLKSFGQYNVFDTKNLIIQIASHILG